jgi:citronellol/citronellal dehydrogenase
LTLTGRNEIVKQDFPIAPFSGKRGVPPRALTGEPHRATVVNVSADATPRDERVAVVTGLLAPGSLGGKRALVTGAGTGIGRGIAIRLAELGADVVGIGRRVEPLIETGCLVAAATVGTTAGSFSWRALDLRDKDAATAAAEEVAGAGGLDLLVNNAGGQFIAPAIEISDRGMAAVLDLNLTAVANLTRAARPSLAENGGTVVTISLSSPERGITGLAHSATARAAFLALTRRLAREWGEDGIRLYGVAPGTVFTDGVRGEMSPEALQGTLRNTPLRADTAIEEIAEWVAALAAGVGPLPSGTVLQLDGGAGIHGVEGLTG